MVQYFPNLVHQLITNQSFIAQLATQYVFASVYAFDQLHRLNLANDPGRRWDVVDDLIFNSHLRGAPLLRKFSQSASSSFSSLGYFLLHL